MNMIKTTSLAIALSIALGGCANENMDEQADKRELSVVEPDKKEENKQMNAQNSRLLKMLAMEQDKELQYQGTAEFKYRLKLNHVEQIDDVTFISYKGWFEDRRGGEPDKKGLYMDYLVSKDEIYQLIKNVDTSQEKHSSQFISIIPHQIVLQAPLEIRHSWEQEFLYDPNLYFEFNEPVEPQYLTAVHTITDIDTNGGKPIFTVETEVKGAKGFYNETYKEVKRWEQDKGLISFESTLPLFDGMPEGENSTDTLTLGYNLVN